MSTWTLSPDRCFSPEPARRALARALYARVKDLPLVCPHGHVDPELLAGNLRLGSPSGLLILPDHYVLRMLYSQGIPLEKLGVPSLDGTVVETDPRKVWKLFCSHFHLYQGTPSGLWLAQELIEVFGVTQRPSAETADALYDQIEAILGRPDFLPQALFRRYRIEVLCTTDAPADTLAPHRIAQQALGKDKVRPTFRPDALTDLTAPGWKKNVEKLSEAAKTDVHDYPSYIKALETRRAFFKENGAVATDHGATVPYTEQLDERQAGEIFGRAMAGRLEPDDRGRFIAHMLMEMARMSVEDGLVMQLHAGSFRNHSDRIFQRFGPDKGGDIPVAVEWTRNLHALLNAYGHDDRLRLILFSLDESGYSRELAPLAGFYPALRLGPPWWFHDSVNGMTRYLDQVLETAGIHNTAGFNDDTRAFLSIPARHDVWRRVTCDWLAGQCVRGLLDEADAPGLAAEFAVGLAKKAYRLP